MPAYGPETETGGSRRQGTLAIALLIVALSTSYLPSPAQQRIAWSMRVTILRPFLAAQERLAEARMSARSVTELMAQMDSMTALLSTRAALADENRTLRDLLDLSQRAGPSFVPATVVRPGTAGSESMFLLQVGLAQGIREGAPVVNRHGLVGVILEVREEISLGMDWTHPDFKVSAMLQDGTMYGIVENRRGAFREMDRLVLNGTAYNEEAPPGTPVLTSGLGRAYPRGIPVGVIDEVEDTQGQWRKSYWLRAMNEPGAVTHVLVGTGGTGHDVWALWSADSARATESATVGGRRQ